LQANSAIPHFAGAVKTSCPHFVDDVKTFCIPCSSNKPEPVRTSGDLSVTFTSSDDSNNEQDKGSDDEQDEGSDDEQHAGTKDKKDEDSDDEQDEGSDDKNPVSTKCFSEDVFGSSSSDDVNEMPIGRKGVRRSEKAKVPEDGGSINQAIIGLKTCERLCAYLYETTNIKHAESRPRLANTWKCRGY